MRIDFDNGICELLAPDIFPTEMGNALLMAECVKKPPRIGPGEAAFFLAELLQSPPITFGTVPLLPRALEIAKQHRRSIYDCLYVALAEREQCEFVSADERLVYAIEAAFPFVLWLGAM